MLFFHFLGYYLSEDSIRVRTVLKALISNGDCIWVGTLFETGLYSRLYGSIYMMYNFYHVKSTTSAKYFKVFAMETLLSNRKVFEILKKRTLGYIKRAKWTVESFNLKEKYQNHHLWEEDLSTSVLSGGR